MINYTIDELMSRLGCKKFPERWREIYDDAKSILENGENPLLRPEYYDELEEKYHIFRDTLPYYKKAAQMVAEKEELALYFCLICRALRDRATIQSDIRGMELPQAPEGEDILPYDMLTALAMCQSTPDVHKQLAAHNVPEDLMTEALHVPVFCVELHLSNGRPRLTNFDWYQHAYDGKLYRVGRLQLEFPLYMPNFYRVFENGEGEIVSLANLRVHRDGYPLGSRGYEDEEGAFTAEITETDEAYIGYPHDKYGRISREKITIPKSEWKVKLKAGDPLVGLHIPRGKGFENEAIEETLKESRKLLAECYPEYKYKAIFCASWLLDKQLVDILGEDANISKFCNRFIAFGTKSAGTSPFGYVFQKSADTPLEELPENTRLQRALKQHYISGKAIYDCHGVFFD